ncbi:GLUT4 regulating protein TUG-domain-containing protein [Bombardia bombarda]|uniref:GLUT4 regulating protein TUG-domain-containing protein n=1 Tax=Bombardia bombarda TaxID=252184 RepID=A0AA40BY62_9PEZI|nr:GLUT4 regulating protein TUG-domain-containing protein [Bombardia bombarda]
MSAHVEVVSTDLRRVKVKVTPGTYMVDVLHEGCKKLNLQSDKYLLKHKQKTLDLSGPFRTSGLSPGAKLELVQKSSSPSVVSIALDVAGQRYTKKLPSNMALWQVLRQFESSEKNLDITGKAWSKSSNGGQLYHEAPVLNIMGREYSSLEDLQKTLSQCGINSGSIALRVSFRQTEKTLEQAMTEIGTYLKEVEPEQPKKQETKEEEPAPASTTSEGTEATQTLSIEATEPETPAPAPTTTADTAAATAPEQSTSTTTTDLMDIDSPPPSQQQLSPETTTTPQDPLQPTDVFLAPSSSTLAAAQAANLPDSIYEPTIAHAQLRQQQLLARAQNTRLKSDAELAADAAEEAARLARITRVDVKVRFPDQTSAQWVARPEHAGSFLHDAVRAVMAHPDQKFKLVMSGPKAVVVGDDAKLLIASYRFKGRELLNLVWEDGVSDEARAAPFLKGSVASRAHEGSGGSAKPVKKDNSGGMDSETLKRKLGKMFKLPGKK